MSGGGPCGRPRPVPMNETLTPSTGPHQDTRKGPPHHPTPPPPLRDHRLEYYLYTKLP